MAPRSGRGSWAGSCPGRKGSGDASSRTRWGCGWPRRATAAPISRRGCGCSSSSTPIPRRSRRATARSSCGRGSTPGTSISRRTRCGSCCGSGAGRTTTAPSRRTAPFSLLRPGAGLQLDDVLRRRTLLSLHDVELDPLALGERLEPLRLDRGVVHEAVLLAVLRRDETEPLRVVEPLHDTGDACHLAGTPDLMVFATSCGLHLAACRGLVFPSPYSARALVEALPFHVLKQSGFRDLTAEFLQDIFQSVAVAYGHFHPGLPVRAPETVKDRGGSPGPRNSLCFVFARGE